MKGSDFGVLPPPSVGDLMYAPHEDGDGDGLWRNSATTEDEAVEELREASDSELDGRSHGYLADAVEAEVDGPDAYRILEQVNEWASERYGESVDDWPSAGKEVIQVLQERLDKVFGEWLTEFSLWPSFCGIENIRRIEFASQGEQPHEGDGK
jgi:hypothetical protein